MLALTKKTDYALIAVSHLAKRAELVLSAREIAQACGVPQSILTNILKMLAGAGIVVSTRGATGGYSLARPVEAISLHDLITTIEGPFQFVQCAVQRAQSGRNPCGLESSCPIRSPVFRVYGRMKEFLENVTVAELLDSPEIADEPPSGEASLVSARGAGSDRECNE